tara:strand:- start:810 stop:1211 length:402 start_codon:yes stop_codon:yes gene_type:complete
MKLAIATLIAFSSISPAVVADELRNDYRSTGMCSTSEYREEYVPGNKNSPGYVKIWNEAVQVPCSSTPRATARPTMRQQPVSTDTNDCSEGTLIGGLLGAGLAASGSRGRDQWWAIPAGGAAGAMVGCQIDGG